MDIANRLQLHYYLDDDSHTMDATVRNKCEAEILAIVYEAISVLDLNLTIDSEALKQGGLREIWKILGENSVQIALILTVIAILLSQIPNVGTDLGNLQKELTTL